MLSIVEFVYCFLLRWACAKVQIEAAIEVNNEIEKVIIDELVVDDLSVIEELNEMSIVRVCSVDTEVVYDKHI